MIPIFTGKNEFKIRQNLLRGVYEENLFMLGRGNLVLSRRKFLPLKRILLSAVICILAVLMHGQYMGSSFAPAEQTVNMSTLPDPLPAAGVSLELTPDMNMLPDPLPAAGVSSEGTVNTSEFSAFVNSHNVFFSRMLGLKIKTIMIDAGHGGTDLGHYRKDGYHGKGYYARYR